MDNRRELSKRFWFTFTVMLVVGAITSLSSIYILYRSAVATEMSRLESIVASKASLIDSVALFDAKYSQVDHPQGAVGATISQVQTSFESKQGFGETGEFVVGRIKDGQIEFLLSSRQDITTLKPIARDKHVAEPMRKALQNQSGTIIGLDYLSRKVIAAYHPVPNLEFGLVAKIDVSEVQKPFIDACVKAALIALFIIIMGILLITQIEDKEQKKNEDFALDSGVTPREWLMYRSLLLAVVSIVSVTSSIGLLYQSSSTAEQKRLLDMVETQGSLIDAVANFDAKYNDADFPGGARKATIKQIRESMVQSSGFGKTGELILGEFNEQKVLFLMPSRHSGTENLEFHIAEQHSNAMKQAIAGYTGTLQEIDYRGQNVVVAYSPVKKLQAGLIAKIDLTELKLPFIDAGIKASVIVILINTLGIFLLWKVYEITPRRRKDRVWFDCQGLSDEDGEKSRWPVLIFTLGLGFSLLSIDLFLPLGVAGGVTYIFFVLCGKLYPRREYTLLLAVLATLLTFIGYLFSPVGAPEWVVVVNRLLSVAAIWVTAVIVSLSQAQHFAQRAQASQLRQLSLAVEHSPASVIMTDPEGIVQYVNRTFTEMTGYCSQEVVGKKSNLTRSGNTPNEVYEQLWRCLKSGQKWQGEFHNKKKSGELYCEHATIHPITSSTGKVLNYVAIQQDITQRKKYEQKLKYLATHDNLTGLPSRSLCLDRLSKLIDLAKRKSCQAAVLFVDLDGFKEVNDCFGHNVGDLVLVETAKRLQSCVRKADTVARIGGDEFLILLSEIAHPDDASHVAQKVLEATSLPFSDFSHEIVIGVSIGIALFPDHAACSEKLIRYADKAMYKVKIEGKNNFSFASRPLKQ